MLSTSVQPLPVQWKPQSKTKTLNIFHGYSSLHANGYRTRVLLIFSTACSQSIIEVVHKVVRHAQGGPRRCDSLCRGRGKEDVTSHLSIFYRIHMKHEI